MRRLSDDADFREKMDYEVLCLREEEYGNNHPEDYDSYDTDEYKDEFNY